MGCKEVQLPKEVETEPFLEALFDMEGRLWPRESRPSVVSWALQDCLLARLLTLARMVRTVDGANAFFGEEAILGEFIKGGAFDETVGSYVPGGWGQTGEECFWCHLWRSFGLFCQRCTCPKCPAWLALLSEKPGCRWSEREMSRARRWIVKDQASRRLLLRISAKQFRLRGVQLPPEDPFDDFFFAGSRFTRTVRKYDPAWSWFYCYVRMRFRYFCMEVAGREAKNNQRYLTGLLGPMDEELETAGFPMPDDRFPPAEVRDLRFDVEECIGKLDQRSREFILRRYFEGDGIRDITEDHAISDSNVKIVLHRARPKLRELLVAHDVSADQIAEAESPEDLSYHHLLEHGDILDWDGLIELLARRDVRGDRGPAGVLTHLMPETIRNLVSDSLHQGRVDSESQEEFLKWLNEIILYRELFNEVYASNRQIPVDLDDRLNELLNQARAKRLSREDNARLNRLFLECWFPGKLALVTQEVT